MLNISPLAPDRFPALAPVPGVRLATGSIGERYAGRDDLLLVELDPETTLAGVTTRSKTAAAPVLWTREIVAKGRAGALVVNAGNANAFTGRPGETTVARTVEVAASVLGRPAGHVPVASTGVIGQRLDAGRIAAVLPDLAGRLSLDGWQAAADAIRTTDTFAKGAGATTRIGDADVTISGIAKGSGMIAPDLATMFAFVFTDAKIPAEVLDTLVRGAAALSFNAITVDSDTSTSDTVLVFATGAGARHPKVTASSDGHLAGFRRALRALMTDLAQQIVRDGEGASKFVTVRVSGARSARAARNIGMAIANSPLVKTALAGEDPNWGRVIAAVGKAGEEADRDKLRLSFGPYRVAENGMLRPGYVEAPVAAYMRGAEIEIAVDVGVGTGRFTVWTCDLGDEYVRINADYRS